jgi:glycosyltransferase involved in cell wall biosynthesis
MSAPEPRPAIAILLPDLRGGGAERVCINLANEFAERGLEVEMLLMRAEGELMPLLDPSVRIVDFRAQRVRSLVVPLIRHLRRSRPASLLANMWPLTALAVLVKSLLPGAMRVVTVEHVVLSRSEIARRPLHMAAMRLISRLLLRRADAVVCVSDGVADDLAALTGTPRSMLTTVYNPIVGKGVVAAPVSLPGHVGAWLRSGHRLLNVGEFKAQKDQATLLRAFALLPAESGAHLLFLGNGALEEELAAMAVSLGVAERVTFAGFAPDPAPYYRAASLFVLSSAWEGFGNVIVEAMEQGTPVVSTDCQAGPSEILAGGAYGRLVPVGDAKALAGAIQAALGQAHDSERLKRRASEFSVVRAADAYLHLLLPGMDGANYAPSAGDRSDAPASRSPSSRQDPCNR